VELLDRWIAKGADSAESGALSAQHLEGFRRSQSLAYDSVTAVERELREGMTERQAAARVAEYLADHGVRQFFHRPFAWFGDRSALRGMRTDLGFFPTRRRLRPGMAVILDVAPIVEGYASDIGYACKLGANALHDQMLADLEAYRTLVLAGVRAGRSMRAIYRDVDALIERQGYDNRHARYPGHVLAHKVDFVPPAARTERALLGFGPPALAFLGSKVARTRAGDRSQFPLWNAGRVCEQPASPGLWAVEPHIGLRDVGVKWEELLVVPAEGEAHWLDDDLPHVRRFAELAARGIGSEQREVA
jgi:hypothetical protein